jgi:hypothetical protein
MACHRQGARRQHTPSEALGEPVIEHEYGAIDSAGEPMMLSGTLATSIPYQAHAPERSHAPRAARRLRGPLVCIRGGDLGKPVCGAGAGCVTFTVSDGDGRFLTIKRQRCLGVSTSLHKLFPTALHSPDEHIDVRIR